MGAWLVGGGESEIRRFGLEVMDPRLTGSGVDLGFSGVGVIPGGQRERSTEEG